MKTGPILCNAGHHPRKTRALPLRLPPRGFSASRRRPHHLPDSHAQNPSESAPVLTAFPRKPTDPREFALRSGNSRSSPLNSRRVPVRSRRLFPEPDHLRKNPASFPRKSATFPRKSGGTAVNPDRNPGKSDSFWKKLIRSPKIPSGFCQRPTRPAPQGPQGPQGPHHWPALRIRPRGRDCNRGGNLSPDASSSKYEGFPGFIRAVFTRQVRTDEESPGRGEVLFPKG